MSRVSWDVKRELSFERSGCTATSCLVLMGQPESKFHACRVSNGQSGSIVEDGNHKAVGINGAPN